MSAILDGPPAMLVQVGALDDQLIGGPFNQDHAFGQYEPQRVVPRKLLEVLLGIAWEYTQPMSSVGAQQDEVVETELVQDI